MKNIHILPTDKPSRLYKKINNELSFTHVKFEQKINGFNINQNIYITSYEEIKEGVNQWYLDKFLNKPRNSSGSHYGEKQNVIILTTDQDLIKDGVQAIDDEFLEWFVNNPSCESVEVEYGDDGNGYQVIIPKEEPKMIECYFTPRKDTSSATICSNCGQEKFMHTIGSGIKVSKSVIITKEEPKQRLEKYSERFDNKDNEIVDGIFNPDTWGKRLVDDVPKQETHEEAAERYAKSEALPENQINCKEDFIAGAKWQQQQTKELYSEEQMDDAYDKGFNDAIEKTYSEEEVLDILIEFCDNFYENSIRKDVIEKWLEQFKNK